MGVDTPHSKTRGEVADATTTTTNDDEAAGWMLREAMMPMPMPMTRRNGAVAVGGGAIRWMGNYDLIEKAPVRG